MSLYLKKFNTHERDSRIFFDEEPHIYYIDGCCKGYISSTTIIHSFFGQFNADLVAKKMVATKNVKYKNMTVDEIKEQWELNRIESSTAGTLLHKNVEEFYNDIPVCNESVEYGFFLNFQTDYKDLTPYRTEWEIFDEEHKIAGSIDMIFKDVHGYYWIADWKRSKEIKKFNKYQKGKPPLEHMDDCNFNQYSLQLNLYKYILEKHYGISIFGMFLVVLHPNNRNYVKLDVECKQKEISWILTERKNQMTILSELEEHQNVSDDL